MCTCTNNKNFLGGLCFFCIFIFVYFKYLYNTPFVVAITAGGTKCAGQDRTFILFLLTGIYVREKIKFLTKTHSVYNQLRLKRNAKFNEVSDDKKLR